MQPASSSALAAVRDKSSDNKAHFISGTGSITGTGPDALVTLSFPLRELDRARPGTGQRRSHGFSLEATVDIPGQGKFALRTAWVSISAR
jgi:hypothetical protein